MKVGLIDSNGQKIYVNGKVDSSNIISYNGKIELNPKLLEGQENPQGEEVLLLAESYRIGRQIYPLTKDYAIKAVLSKNGIIPVLRAARGKEKNIFKRTKQENRFSLTKLEGEDNNFWPEIVKCIK